MGHLDLGHRLEQFGRQMGRRTRTDRTVVGLVLVLAGPVDELVDRRIRRIRRRDHQQGDDEHDVDRLEILHRVIVDFWEEADVHRMRAAAGRQQGVAIGCRLGDHLGSDHPGSAAAIFNQHRLFPAVGQVLGDQTRHDVGGAPGRIRHDHLDGLGRIVLSGLRLHERGREQHTRCRHDGQPAIDHDVSP